MIENLTPQQVQAAQLLARGLDTSRIVDIIKISESTFYRWKRQKQFKELINSILTAELAETRVRMAHLADASVTALWELVTQNRNDYTRLQAVICALKLTGVACLPSPNVTQTVRYVPAFEEEEEPDALPQTEEMTPI